MSNNASFARPRRELLPHGVWRSDGHGMVTGIYRSERAAIAAAPQVLEIRGGLAGFLASMPRTETCDYPTRIIA